MQDVSIGSKLKELIPGFKIGFIYYHDIVIGASPQMLKGRLLFFQEELALTLQDKELASFNGINTWRSIFKKVGTDPARYRPSSEALYRRIKKGHTLAPINSAVDLNNFFSLKYEIPFGIYNLDKITAPIEVRIGSENDQYLGINERTNDMTNKIVSADDKGAFGSPIVDSRKTMVTDETTSALHIVYLQHTMDAVEANELLTSVAKMFTDVHGGNYNILLK
ncbi:B3/B4 domain-containing protein [Bacillus sp. FJAT-45350]|uniref:B3/B4 domain-containing protein n=1 Tax=Bacillus sp. FJAT-45350 TaxID=2011014 RepID=UPI000BB87643|nr:phenylalanine--tRNA ligase beta subunit-related protein [Bacillus sp. FJAT-45350]